MSFFSFFNAAAEKAAGAKVERRTAERLQNVEDDLFPDRVKGDPFEPGNSYFGVRLAGLHLVDARRFATEFLPLCVCLADFTYDGQPRGVPFSIGPDVLRQRLSQAGVDANAAQAKPAWVELADLRVVKPTPVNADNLSLYAGLYSVPGDDFVKTLLNVVGDVGSAVGAGAAIGPGLKIAETVYSSFGTLLGTKGVGRQVEALNGTILTSSGYFLAANASRATADPATLRVVKGRLCWPKNGGKNGEMVTDFDYCLLAIEHFKTVVESASGMAPVLFPEQWKAVTAAIGDKKQQAAADAFDRLQGAILNSPDLIEADRVSLLGGYQARYDQYAGIIGAGRGKRGDGEAGITDRIDQAVSDLKGKNQKLAQKLAYVSTAAAAVVDERIDEAAIGSEEAVLSAARSVRRTLIEKKLLTVDADEDAALATALARAAVGYVPQL